MMGRETAVGWRVHHRADHVARKQVRRELDALEVRTERLGQGLHQQGLRKPGHPLEQNVATGEQGYLQPLDNPLLPEYRLADLASQPRGPAGPAGERCTIFMGAVLTHGAATGLKVFLTRTGRKPAPVDSSVAPGTCSPRQ